MKILLPNPEDTQRLGFALGKRVLMQPSWGKDLFLFGDIGIGKTTFLKGFSRGLGITENINSPTFALVSEYPVSPNSSGIQTFSHLDIFRVQGDSVLALPEIFEKLEDPSLVLALEWADKLPQNIFPENRIEIRFSLHADHYDSRQAELEFFNPEIPDDTTVQVLLAECQTPLFIRKHTALVTKIATLLAKKFIEKGFPVHFDLVRASALLHDIHWMCSYLDFSRDSLSEKASDQEWSAWAKICDENQDKDAYSAAESYLRNKGFSSVADIISRLQVQNLSGPYSLEEVCLVLAHFYVYQEKAMLLSDRFVADAGFFAKNKEIQTILLKLEESISRQTGLLPEEIIAAR